MLSQIDKIKRIMALAETGVVYYSNEFELERCQEQRELCLELLAEMVNKPLEVINELYMPPVEYPTPKVDVRGFVLNDKGQLLMVRESMDGKWSIPGGWTDIGFSPKEVVEKEVLEETGLTVSAKQLMAVWDKKCHPHPPSAHHIYKMVFWCVTDKFAPLKKAHDILDVAFFDVNNLPELSIDRILKEQIDTLVQYVKEDRKDTIFD